MDLSDEDEDKDKRRIDKIIHSKDPLAKNNGITSRGQMEKINLYKEKYTREQDIDVENHRR